MRLYGRACWRDYAASQRRRDRARRRERNQHHARGRDSEDRQRAERCHLHEHLLSQGFLTFVASRHNGPLFYNAVKGEARVSAATNPVRRDM